MICMNRLKKCFWIKYTSSTFDPCLCESIKWVLFWSRITGISTVSVNSTGHYPYCNFKTSGKWTVYSRTLQTIYFLYILVLYGSRLVCPSTRTEQDWYLVTFGYFIGDAECLFTLIFGVWQSANMCTILKKLSKFNENILERRTTKKYVRIILCFILIFFSISLITHIYVATGYLSATTGIGIFGCLSLDTTLALIIRGLTVISPTMQVTVTFILTYIIGMKFRELAISTQTTLNKIKSSADSRDMLYTGKRSHLVLTILKEYKIQTLEEIATTHKELFTCIEECNRCVGLQLILALTSSLYSIIYNLYQYSTQASGYPGNMIPQKIHYIISLMYRLTKMLIYMLLGKFLNKMSIQPLKTLQDFALINFPPNEQQQVQTLILQWGGKVGYLSAFGIVNFGPWLLAPIVGNVVTYLLVALQFYQSNKEDKPTMPWRDNIIT